MYQVSSLFQEKIKSNDRVYKADIEIQHSQGVLNLTDEDLVLGSLLVVDKTQEGDDFVTGGVVISELELSISNKPEYANIEFKGANIKPKVALLLDSENTTNSYFYGALPYEFTDPAGELYEYVPLGIFTIDKPKVQKNRIKLTALDNMSKLDKPYSLSQLSYPATLFQIYTNICNICDVQIGTVDFLNKNYQVTERPEGDLSCRDVLSFVAQLAGCFAKANRAGEIELRWYTETGLILDGSNRENFIPADYEVQIKGVLAAVDETSTYLVGSEDYAIDLSGNLLLQDNKDIILQAIYDKINPTKFYPFESSWQGNPAIEAGDIITQLGLDGKTYKTLVTSSTYKYRGKSKLMAQGLPIEAKGYKDSDSARLIELKRKIEKDVGDKLTTLEQAQLNATELMANMLGGHIIKDEENGIIYIADMPDIEKAVRVWKWGTGGFGYSENGVAGPYETAITADGSIVAMLITAGIVTADKVQTGTLQSQDGSSWINLDTGEFNLKNKIKFVNGTYTLLMSDGTPVEDAIADLPVHNIILGNENQSFTTTSTGATTSQMVLTTSVTALKGMRRIDGTIGTLVIKDSIGTPITPAGVTLSKVNPTLTTDGSVTMTINSGVNLSSDSGWIEMPIQIEGMNYIKKLSWSKAKAGAQGEKGDTGTGLNIIGTLESTNDLPVSGTAGDAYLIEGNLWTWEGSAWVNVGNVQGPPGQDGAQGPPGQDGVQGPPGQDGVSSYFHVRYSQNANGNPMTTSAVGAVYMGTCVTSNNTGPAEYSAYTWALIKGQDGANGIAGPPGEDGVSSYLHIKYSDDGLTFTANNGETPGAWIGTYVDYVATDSTTFSDYTWKRIEGSPGSDAKIINILPSASYFVTDSVGPTAADYVYTPNSITLTPDLQNCEYDKWQYSLNGTSWTNVVSGQNGLTINTTTKALNIANNSTLYNTQAYVLFKVIGKTGEYDLITIPRIYNNINLATRVSTVEQEVTADSIIAKVETKVAQGGSSIAQKSDIVQTAQSWIARFGTMQNLKIRYIRDWLNGSVESPTFSYWNELQVFNSQGKNIAITSGTVTASSAENATYPIARWRDGSLSTYARVTGTGWQYLQWDLGAANLDIRAIGIKHYGTGRRYNHRLEVSEDGINWFTLYNSDVDGYYLEEANPTMYYINQFKQGIVTMNGEGVKVEHTGLGGQYSQIRADGFIRKWQYGEAKYLNDIHIDTFKFATTWGTSQPPAQRIYLPASFRGRGSTCKIFLSMIGWYAIPGEGLRSSGGRLTSITTSLKTVLEVVYSNFDVTTPYVDVNSYIIQTFTDFEEVTYGNIDYGKLDFMIMVVGY